MIKYEQLQNVIFNFSQAYTKYFDYINNQDSDSHGDIEYLISLKKYAGDIKKFVQNNITVTNNVRKFDEMLIALDNIFSKNDIETVLEIAEEYLNQKSTHPRELVDTGLPTLHYKLFNHYYESYSHTRINKIITIIGFHLDDLRNLINDGLEKINSNMQFDAHNFNNTKKAIIRQLGFNLEAAILDYTHTFETANMIDKIDYKYALIKNFDVSWLKAKDGVKRRWLEQIAESNKFQ